MPTREAHPSDRCYRVAHTYIDRGNPYKPGDEFSGWLAVDRKTIGMTGGIRPRSFINLIDAALPAYVVLVTTHVSADYANPWDDLIDERAGVIRYWGDAKFSNRGKMCDDFQGNRCMKTIYDELLIGDKARTPPILHFTRKATGRVVFNGLCALEGLDLTWFEDQGRPIRNYRYALSILDAEVVSIDWLRGRMTAKSVDAVDPAAPLAWKQYVAGRTMRRQVWKAQIVPQTKQLPAVGTDDGKILQQLAALPPRDFESVMVGLFREMRTIEHSITQTRYVNDKGFDFFGTFTMPLPVGYEIPFRGEAKRYSRSNGVGVGEVSRLVARLRRGEYGIFVTTSYYTKQAQEEVIEDAYPIRLFSGIDLVKFLHELKLVNGGEISRDWLSALLQVRDPVIM